MAGNPELGRKRRSWNLGEMAWHGSFPQVVLERLCESGGEGFRKAAPGIRKPGPSSCRCDNMAPPQTRSLEWSAASRRGHALRSNFAFNLSIKLFGHDAEFGEILPHHKRAVLKEERSRNRLLHGRAGFILDSHLLSYPLKTQAEFEGSTLPQVKRLALVGWLRPEINGERGLPRRYLF